MLDVELLDYTQVERAASIFHRDGFVAIQNALTPQQLAFAQIPTLAEEPEWMKRSVLCAPAGTAIIRDVRCWHGGTANNSDEIRPMMGFGYLAPWFRLPNLDPSLPRALYETLSPRAQTLCRFIVRS